MNAVVEIGIVGKVVDPDPLYWFASAQARANRFEIWTVGPDLLMTIHAGFRRRHSRRRGDFDGGMAVAAIDTVVAYMMFVTELNRLLALDPLPRVPGRSINLCSNPKRSEQDKNGAENAQLGKSVGAVLENLWHRRRFANPIRDYNDQRVAGRSQKQSCALIEVIQVTKGAL